MKSQTNKIPLFELSIIVSQKNDKPFIELRAGTGDTETIKIILLSAFNNQPLIMQPVYKNKIKSISSLVEKGLIYIDNGQLYFNL